MKELKKNVYANKTLRKIVVPVYHNLRRKPNFNSQNYWEQRYEKGGNSGAGSYGRLSEYKADFLNNFAKKNNVSSVIEFGSGDGNQLKLFKFKKYIGLDVSKTSIAICINQYAKDTDKSFYLYDSQHFLDNQRVFSADLTMSLDVIYHLVEDEVFEKYMRDMFNAADKYVIIYASNTNENPWGQAQHVRHRKFTDWVKKYQKDWTLVDQVKNEYSLETNEIDESFADFYIYKKVVRTAKRPKAARNA